MGKARNDLEYERFGTTSDGLTAVRVTMPDALPVSLTGDIQIGAVEIKNASSDQRAIVDSSGNLQVIDTSSVSELTLVKNSLTDGSQVVTANDLDIRAISTSGDSIMSYQGGNWGITNSSFGVAGTASVSDSQAIIELQTLNSLIPSRYDYISCGYDTASNLTSATFKLGGATGSTVSTLTLAYTGATTSANLVSVTKS